MTPDSPLMTSAETAAYLRVTTRTLRRYVARGILPSYRLGASTATRFKRTEVEAFLHRQGESVEDIAAFIARVVP